MDLVQVGCVFETHFLDMDTLSIGKECIPIRGDSSSLKRESGEVERFAKMCWNCVPYVVTKLREDTTNEIFN